MNKKDFQLAQIHTNLTPGEALKMLRELQGLTQDDLAGFSGMTQSNISALENNVRQIGRSQAIVLAADKSELDDLKQAEEQLEKLLRSQGLEEEELLREFRALRVLLAK